MGLFGKKKEEDFFETDDRLIVLDHEQNVCSIYENAMVEGDKVMETGKIAVPLADCKVFVGDYGRVFIANCDKLEYIANARRLGELEVTTTLKQLVEFKPEKKPNPNADMKFWLVGLALLIAIIL